MDTKEINTLVLANAVELGQSIIARVVGDDISNHLNGEPVRAQDIADTITANLGKRLAKYTGA